MSRKGYFFDTSVLNTWSEMNAWLLGFSFADMHRCRTQEYHGKKQHLINKKYISYLNEWHLGQENQNYELLIKIKNYFKASNDIECKKDGSYVLSFFSEEMSKYFDGYMVFDKMKHKYPFDIPKEYDRHFMRGHMDGDGSVWIDKNNVFGCYFMGGPDILNTIKQKLYDIGIVSKSIRKMDVEAYRLEFSEKNSKLVCEYLYSNANIYLPSKYEKYLSISGPLDSNIEVNSQLKSVNKQNAEGKTDVYLSNIIRSRRDLVEMLKCVLGNTLYVIQSGKGLEVYKYPYKNYATKGWDIETAHKASQIFQDKGIKHSIPRRGKGLKKSYTLYVPFVQTHLHAAQTDNNQPEGIVQFKVN